ncbi:MAG: hypothetical protein ABFS21_09075 [Actinomycetota bacterium]
MNDRDTLRTRFHIANPVPDPDTIDAAELDQILSAIESEWDEVRGLGTSPTRLETDRRPWFIPAVVFAAATVLLLLAVGLPMLFLGGERELPPIEEPTTVATTIVTTVPATTAPITVPPQPSTTTTSEVLQATPAPAMTWERVPHSEIFEDATIWTVVAGGPGLVAGGWLGDLWGDAYYDYSDGAVFISADGTEWERIEDPPFAGGVTDLAVGPDSTIVALGCGGDTSPIWVSENGRDWENVDSDLFGPGCRVGAQWVAAGGPGFVAVGNTRSDDAAVWLSQDGREWTQVEDESLLATEEDDWRLRLSGVIEGGPGLVAIGGVGIGPDAEFDAMGVWVSEDGTDWERLPNLDDDWVGHISRDPETGRLFALGSHMWTSDDGIEWTRHEQQDPYIHPADATLAWNGERVVAAGPHRNLWLWASGDRGDSWARIDPNDPVFDGDGPQINSVVAFGDSFVAVGESGRYGNKVAVVWIGRWDD